MILDKIKLHAPEMVRMIPDEELSRLARETHVDYYSKVLSGERMFNLLLYAFVNTDRMSQRRLEVMFNSQQFKAMFNYAECLTVSRSSISTRLSKMNVSFFEKAYGLIYGRLSELYTEREIGQMYLIRVDSSMVAEACNKLKKGFTIGKKAKGREDRKQLKYTVAYDGFAAKLAEVFDEPRFVSEDVAMPAVLDTLIKTDARHSNLYVMDRGLASSASFEAMSDSEAKFVGRIKTNRGMEVVRNLMEEGVDKDLGRLELVDDIEVRLYTKTKEKTKRTFRVVKARFKEPRDTTRPANKGRVKRVENDIYFITNDFGLTPKEVAEAYRHRWDIEVFFRFLKQELSFSHFLSLSENGIKIVLYMTLITAMLIMIYKRENELGYDMAKFCFRTEMNDWVTTLAVFFSGGDVASFTSRHHIRT